VKSDPRLSLALDILKRLRQRGFEAFFAGGCVRDRLLDRIPNSVMSLRSLTSFDCVLIALYLSLAFSPYHLTSCDEY
jgi:tRNA nucleotidyltransferase/poly(A) polymerase